MTSSSRCCFGFVNVILETTTQFPICGHEHLIIFSTSALGWSIWGGTVWEILAMLAGISLFGGVYWSKFAHMFFKPFAAYDKRIKKLSGALDNLPHETRFDKSGAVVAQQRDRHSMELLKDAPMNMGLGIKREGPNHY